MYELKTLLPKFEIDVPKCMYEMKNLNTATLADATSSSHLTVSNVSCDDTQSVVKRQEKVLQQLDDLKKQLAGIRSTLGLCQKGSQHTSFACSKNGGLREEPLHDIVINGHPNFIPYALLALKNAWKELFTIDVKTFTHSTMNDIGKDAKAFEEALKSVPVNPAKPKVNITLIWKNCEHTEMISSPTMYVPIYGEVNIIRYLGRVGPAEYRYEESLLCNEIDAVLDICYQLLRCTTPKSKANIVRTLNNRLQKQLYFGGEKMSIADIGVHSSLRRMPSITDKDLTPALIEWRKRVAKFTLI
ncbi:aaRS-interacting multifunctional protein 2 isoform X2 [Haematobia irritans]|uniref:aaRS-interacting multifunctional protein 2 isoform X2 n=1 Tax=Haematobia irritans TaxID=7368 RepID=UPI003F5075ED